MAEYIEREALIKELQEEIEFDSPIHNEVENDWLTRGLKIALKDVKRFPTADVVPKSEVVLASSDAVKMLIECHGYALTHDSDVKREVAREIFEEIDVLIDDWKHSRIQSIQFIAELAELKKKYTENIE